MPTDDRAEQDRGSGSPVQSKQCDYLVTKIQAKVLRDV